MVHSQPQALPVSTPRHPSQMQSSHLKKPRTEAGVFGGNFRRHPAGLVLNSPVYAAQATAALSERNPRNQICVDGQTIKTTLDTRQASTISLMDEWVDKITRQYHRLPACFQVCMHACMYLMYVLMGGLRLYPYTLYSLAQCTA